MEAQKIKQLTSIFRKKGYNPVYGSIYDQQQKWLSWYRGEVNDFHFYDIKSVNGLKVGKRKMSLNMAKKVMEDWQSLLFNERVTLEVDDEKAQEIVDKVLAKNQFIEEMSNFVELAMVYGTGVIVEYLEDSEVCLDFVYGDNIIPLSHRNKQISEIAVVQEFQQDGHFYTHVSYHLTDGEVYRIEHELYKSKQRTYLGSPVGLNLVFNEHELSHLVDGYYMEFETQMPFFQIFKPALVNNFDTTSPMGISPIANSISLLEAIDEEFNGLYTEVKLSKKRLLVNSEATKTQVVKDKDGDGNVRIKSVSYFDTDEEIFQSIPMDESIPFKEFAPVYNSAPYIEGLNHKLNLLSQKVGLGNGYYRFDTSGGMTATEVVSKNSDTWRNRNKHAKVLRETLADMMRAILHLEKSVGGYSGNPDDLDYYVHFDDSVIVDDGKRLEELKADVLDGFVPKYRYIADKYHITDEKAKEWLAEAQAEDRLANQMFIDEFEGGLDDEPTDEA
jgi:A118 family predicted phage portal protein